MKNSFKTIVMVALLGIATLLIPAMASADEDDYGYRQSYGRYVISNRPLYYGNRYHSSYYEGHGSYNRHYYNDGYGILTGIAIGALFGYAIGDSGHQHNTYTRTEVIATAPQPVRQLSRNRCLQTREYQTQVKVGGRFVDAYGTACLQPDGSWRYGSATMVPGY